MSGQTPRVVGTTEEFIIDAERELGIKLPRSYRTWLLENNGKEIEIVRLFPVFDARDPRKTWDSIVRNYQGNWQEWRRNVADWGFDSDNLVHIGMYGNGDFCCFDYSRVRNNGEVPIVLWSHETGDTEDRAQDFTDFLVKLERGKFDHD